MKIAGLALSGTSGPARTDRRPQAGDPRTASGPADAVADARVEVRARVTITPWIDPVFARDVREVMRTVSLSDEVVLGSGTGAVLAERLLRERGYGRARVIDARTTAEALRRVAHWRILRDGEPVATDA
jgi:hypothetical protein